MAKDIKETKKGSRLCHFRGTDKRAHRRESRDCRASGKRVESGTQRRQVQPCGHQSEGLPGADHPRRNQQSRELDYLQRMLYGVAKTITEHIGRGKAMRM